MTGNAAIQSPLKCCLLVAALAVTGCSPYDASVTGIVTYDGQPLEEGTVVFVATGVGSTAYGSIEDGGRYDLRIGDDSGLPSGNYRVGVRSAEKIPPAELGDPPKFKTRIPLVFKDPARSGLQFDVAKGKNTIDITLPRTAK